LNRRPPGYEGHLSEKVFPYPLKQVVLGTLLHIIISSFPHISQTSFLQSVGVQGLSEIVLEKVLETGDGLIHRPSIQHTEKIGVICFFFLLIHIHSFVKLDCQIHQFLTNSLTIRIEFRVDPHIAVFKDSDFLEIVLVEILINSTRLAGKEHQRHHIVKQLSCSISAFFMIQRKRVDVNLEQPRRHKTMNTSVICLN